MSQSVLRSFSLQEEIGIHPQLLAPTFLWMTPVNSVDATPNPPTNNIEYSTCNCTHQQKESRIIVYFNQINQWNSPCIFVIQNEFKPIRFAEIFGIKWSLWQLGDLSAKKCNSDCVIFMTKTCRNVQSLWALPNKVNTF